MVGGHRHISASSSGYNPKPAPTLDAVGIEVVVVHGEDRVIFTNGIDVEQSQTTDRKVAA